MIKVNPKDLSEQNNHKLLSASVVPRPVAFVTTLNDDNTVNAAPFSFFGIISGYPPIISVSVLRRNEEMKDTARNILRNKEFVVNITNLDNIDKVNLTATELKVNESEITLAKLNLVNSEIIKTPGVVETPIRLEVKLIKHQTFGDSNKTTVDNFIGEVVLFHLSKNVYDGNYVDFNKLKPIGRLAGNDFITDKGLINIVRPK